MAAAGLDDRIATFLGVVKACDALKMQARTARRTNLVMIV